MKNFKFIHPFLLAIFLNSAESKEILGLNFCGKVSSEEIKKSIEKNDASFNEITTDVIADELIFESKNYKISDVPMKISFHSYKGNLYKIRIDEGRLISDILKAKYGYLRESFEDQGIITLKSYFYNSNDKNIDISLNYIESIPLGNNLTFRQDYVEYLCKSIDKLVIAEKNKIESKKQLEKKGASKL